jgi:hypothetical protein
VAYGLLMALLWINRKDLVACVVAMGDKHHPGPVCLFHGKLAVLVSAFFSGSPFDHRWLRYGCSQAHSLLSTAPYTAQRHSPLAGCGSGHWRGHRRGADPAMNNILTLLFTCCCASIHGRQSSGPPCSVIR